MPPHKPASFSRPCCQPERARSRPPAYRDAAPSFLGRAWTDQPIACVSDGSSLGLILVARVQPLGEAQAGGPIFATLQEIAPIRELAVRVVAGLLAGH